VLPNSIQPCYPHIQFEKKKAATQSHVNLVSKTALDWSPTFGKNQNRIKSRKPPCPFILSFYFFYYLNLQFYKFLDALSESLNLQKKLRTATPYFNKILAQGMYFLCSQNPKDM
jgi:hypothetical protein